MAENSRNSCTGTSRHICIVHYFFVKYRVGKKEIRIKHQPTDQILADYFTKPLQGSLFNKLRSTIMGYSHIKLLLDCPHSVEIKECTGNPIRVIPNNETSSKRVRFQDSP